MELVIKKPVSKPKNGSRNALVEAQKANTEDRTEQQCEQ